MSPVRPATAWARRFAEPAAVVGLAALVLSMSPSAYALTAITPSVPTLPEVQGPVPVTATSRPWAQASTAVEPVDLDKMGYVEEEYFIRGVARTLDWPAAGALNELARGPYITRILVRRPRDAKRFSGTVVVEPLNPSIRYDAPLIWGSAWRHFLRDGDTWIGVTIKPVAISSLKEFDSARYARLGFPNPLPPSQTCGQDKLPMPRGLLPAESTPATENGLMWDALSQVGALVKSSDPRNPLQAETVKRLYMAGDSQSGGFVFNYAQAIHSFVLDTSGKPLWDGYVATVATGPGLPLHQCAAPIPPGDPRLAIRPVGVPLIALASQSEIRQLRRRPDGDIAPDLFRGYELAGSSHIHLGDDAGTPSPADIDRTSGRGFVSTATCKQDGAPGNDVPLGFFLNAIFANLERWSTSGVRPPQGNPIDVIAPGTPTAQVRTDSEGNALGGIRSPHLDVPIARYHARMDGPGICELWGWREPLTKAEIARLYPTKKAYVAKVTASVDALVRRRWLELADGKLLILAAKAEPIP
jgi:hypothetical protein